MFIATTVGDAKHGFSPAIHIGTAKYAASAKFASEDAAYQSAKLMVDWLEMDVRSKLDRYDYSIQR